MEVTNKLGTGPTRPLPLQQNNKQVKSSRRVKSSFDMYAPPDSMNRKASKDDPKARMIADQSNAGIQKASQQVFTLDQNPTSTANISK